VITLEFILIVLVAVIGAAMSYVILYFVIKAAVRDGIIEARNIDSTSNEQEDDGARISKIICPNCGARHDMDYPKCPDCKHQYN